MNKEVLHLSIWEALRFCPGFEDSVDQYRDSLELNIETIARQYGTLVAKLVKDSGETDIEEGIDYFLKDEYEDEDSFSPEGIYVFSKVLVNESRYGYFLTLDDLARDAADMGRRLEDVSLSKEALYSASEILQIKDKVRAYRANLKLSEKVNTEKPIYIHGPVYDLSGDLSGPPFVKYDLQNSDDSQSFFSKLKFVCNAEMKGIPEDAIPLVGNNLVWNAVRSDSGYVVIKELVDSYILKSNFGVLQFNIIKDVINRIIRNTKFEDGVKDFEIQHGVEDFVVNSYLISKMIHWNDPGTIDKIEFAFKWLCYSQSTRVDSDISELILSHMKKISYSEWKEYKNKIKKFSLFEVIDGLY